MGTREHLNQLTITGPLTLDDLRWLVDQSAHLPAGSRVEVKGRKDYNNFDFDPERITVHGPAGTGPPAGR